MVWVNGHGCQRAYSYWYYAAVAEILVALRSPRPSRPVVLFGSGLISRIAVYGPVCTVVWEGGAGEAPPYPDRHLLFVSSH